MDKLPSAALCAHAHDSLSGVSDELMLDNVSIAADQLTSLIYEHPRTMELCKEIAQIAKCVISEENIELDAIHHLPLRKDRTGRVVTDDKGIPYLSGRGWKALNDVIHLAPSDCRDKCLTTLTKLHAYVMPLRISEARPKAFEMINNIQTPFAIPEDIIDRFRNFMSKKPLKALQDYNWIENLYPLHDLAQANYGSSKKKPTYPKGGEIDTSTTQAAESSYILPLILQQQDLRELYGSDKETFMTLITGKPVLSVGNDEHIYRLECRPGPIGRMGVRLQEAEKVRDLWMPLPAFTTLCWPGTCALETLVRSSRHQSTFLDDEVALKKIQTEFFHGTRSQEMIYSIDQSSFTDNFPYKLQRVVLEELVDRQVIPELCLKAFDLEITGSYRPASFLKYDEDVSFAKGTPMGAEGSFMLATITHEFLIEMLAKELHISHPHYWVQGDDAVIQGTELYNEYVNLMASIGCTVNQSKTMQSTRSIEYCGWIATPTQMTPMYRPHNRFTDEAQDVVSSRAIAAFSQDLLVDWIQTNRPDILDQLRITGLITLEDDEEDPQIMDARAVYTALVQSKRCMPPSMSEEQRAARYVYQQYYPAYITSSEEYKHVERSDYTKYCIQINKLKYLKLRLLHDPSVNLQEIAGQISDVCDEINTHYKDHVPLTGNPNKPTHRNPFKPDHGVISDKSALGETLRIIESHIEDLNERKEDNTYDGIIP